MKYILFSTEQAASERNQQILQMGIASNAFPPGTLLYGTVRRHPYRLLFALPLVDAYADLFTPQEVAAALELPADWFRRGQIEGHFLLEQPISPLPADATVQRVVFCNIPEVSTTLPDRFDLRVVIKHYKDGQHIFQQVPDIEDFLKAEGQEFRDFYELIRQGANMLDLIKGQIQVMDSVGRFNF